MGVVVCVHVVAVVGVVVVPVAGISVVVVVVVRVDIDYLKTRLFRIDLFSFWSQLLYVTWVSNEINPLRRSELRNLVSYLLYPFMLSFRSLFA
jgi:hypothetical protein